MFFSMGGAGTKLDLAGDQWDWILSLWSGNWHLRNGVLLLYFFVSVMIYICDKHFRLPHRTPILLGWACAQLKAPFLNLSWREAWLWATGRELKSLAGASRVALYQGADSLACILCPAPSPFPSLKHSMTELELLSCDSTVTRRMDSWVERQKEPGSLRPQCAAPRLFVRGGKVISPWLSHCQWVFLLFPGECSAGEHGGRFRDLHTFKAVDFMQNADPLRVQECEHPLSLGAHVAPASPAMVERSCPVNFQVLGGGERHWAGPLRIINSVKNAEWERQGGVLIRLYGFDRADGAFLFYYTFSDGTRWLEINQVRVFISRKQANVTNRRVFLFFLFFWRAS